MAQFDDKKKVPLTVNQDNLRRLETRLKCLTNWHKGNPEISRLEAAREHLRDSMSAEELEGYAQSLIVILTPAEKKAAAERERLAMEANRDKPSI